MRTGYLVALCAAAFALGGCGSLEVKVDILDHEYVKNVADQRDLRRALAIVLDDPTDAYHKQQIEKARDDVVGAYKELTTKLDQRAADPATTATSKQTLALVATAWRNEGIPQITGRYSNFFARVKASNKAVRDAFDKLQPGVQAAVRSGNAPLPETLRQLLLARNEELRSIDRYTREALQKLRDTVTEVAPTLGAVSSALVEDAKSSATASLNSLTAGQTLAADSNASVVALAPEKSWAPVYNKAFANGILGNVDIAIKMDSVGDFTVKGVAFDPSQVAQVASKVTSQALVVAAQIAGVPIRTGSPSGDGAALAKSSTQLADLNRQRLDAEAEAREARAALIDIGLAVVQEYSALTATDSATNNVARKTALDAVTASYKRQKARINISPPAN